MGLLFIYFFMETHFNKDTFSCIIGGSDCKYKVELQFVLLDYTSLILILWVSWCLHNLSGVMYRGTKAVGSNKRAFSRHQRERAFVLSLNPTVVHVCVKALIWVETWNKTSLKTNNRDFCDGFYDVGTIYWHWKNFVFINTIHKFINTVN